MASNWISDPQWDGQGKPYVTMLKPPTVPAAVGAAVVPPPKRPCTVDPSAPLAPIW